MTTTAPNPVESELQAAEVHRLMIKAYGDTLQTLADGHTLDLGQIPAGQLYDLLREVVPIKVYELGFMSGMQLGAQKMAEVASSNLDDITANNERIAEKLGVSLDPSEDDTQVRAPDGAL